jgi:hypothetical protein
MNVILMFTRSASAEYGNKMGTDPTERVANDVDDRY